MEKIQDMKNSRKNKKGSSGMFFVIIIILVLILLGVWGVKKYLSNRPEVLIEEFPSKLQKDVNDLVNTSRRWEQTDYKLPENFTQVCFKNNEYDNLILKSNSGSIIKQIKHVDLETVVGDKKEFCVGVEDGKAEMILRKKRDNPKVIIEKVE